MSSHPKEPDGPVPLPESPESDGPENSRAGGVRRVRRVSNWTAAALVVGTGAAVLGLAHSTLPSTANVPGVTGTSQGGGAQPQVGHPVATSSGSGVTAGHGTAAQSGAQGGPKVNQPVATTSGSGVTTTKRTVDGKTVITTVRHSDDD